MTNHQERTYHKGVIIPVTHTEISTSLVMDMVLIIVINPNI